ncbi:YaiI/YqxD family protein [Ignatzschineria sp. RMDPL8A]|uniref:YaiI/YqxD family protein n=1 Tax=Ignatzschineria sp. RMDPL8A TaxID=2999236 RepID=UPI0024466366|nr:YaiI/YqxD family protein [Ignatzschineria sp. RMDPL8A]MDG9729237.1 YaiI/YqxD family protein [Ignatzschineria sp. RMDPL8A]
MKQIWVDADAIPNVIKEILFRAANREKVLTTLIANQWIKVPPSRYLKSMQVLQGFDVADNKIVECVNAGDLVITADIPLASDVLEKGGVALNPRGYFYDKGTIAAKLTMRDFNETLRSSGIQTKGPDPLSQKDRQDFSNALDRWLRQVKPS